MSDSLFLNKELYSRKRIAEACNAFSNLSRIETKENDDYWECIFLDSKHDLTRTKLEFENYLIGITNKEK